MLGFRSAILEAGSIYKFLFAERPHIGWVCGRKGICRD